MLVFPLVYFFNLAFLLFSIWLLEYANKNEITYSV